MGPLLTTEAGDATGQVAMTLAAIAYQPNPTSIAALLKNPALATRGRWSLEWYASNEASQAYVARDAQSGQYAVSIRGSVTDPMSPAFWIDWFEFDADVFLPVDWTYGGAPASAAVAQGTWDDLQSLLSLRDSRDCSLLALFQTVAKPVWLTAVVGHSLGGALASVLAPFLHQQCSGDSGALDFWPVTFAAPTVGNKAFADWLEDQFAASLGRYHNTLDVVPRAWAGLQWIADSFPNGPALPMELKLSIEEIGNLLALMALDYRQPGTGNPLTGTIAPNVDWFREAGAQHASAMYLSLLGAPPIPVDATFNVHVSENRHVEFSTLLPNV